MGHNLHLVAALQDVAQRHHTPAYASARTFITYLGVNGISEVENGGSLRQLEEVAVRGEHEHFILVEIHLELIHKLQVVASLEGSADALEPRFHSCLAAFDALVAPVCGKSALSHLVHALCAYLHLHPFPFGPEHSDVQALVAVALWD